ncbi:MAG: hypothetical protein ABL888_18435 [Pirellulaceae bacterium]
MRSNRSQPELRFQSPFGFVAAAMLVLVSAMVGCQTDPKARREIALLKSEIVALEDRYYALKSRCGEVDGEVYNDGAGVEIEYGPGETDPYLEMDPSSNSIQSEPHANPPKTEPSIRQPQQEELKLDLEEGKPIENPADEKKEKQSRLRARQGTPVKTAASSRRAQKDLQFQVIGQDTDGDQIDDRMQIQVELDPSLPPQDLHVSMLDPHLPSGQQRIGNWRFGREEIRKFDSSVLTSTTLKLPIPWDRQPQNNSLLVFVRLTNAESTAEGSTSLIAQIEPPTGEEKADNDPQLISSVPPPNPSASRPSRWRPNR